MALTDSAPVTVVAALADASGGAGEAPDVPDDPPLVDDVPDPSEDEPVVVEPGDVPEEALGALSALLAAPGDPDEHPPSVTDKTNIAMTLETLIDSSWANACRVSPIDDKSVWQGCSGNPTTGRVRMTAEDPQ